MISSLVPLSVRPPWLQRDMAASCEAPGTTEAWCANQDGMYLLGNGVPHVRIAGAIV